jgi:hypothetical protein
MQIETFTKDKNAQVYLTWEDISIMRNALYHYQKDHNRAKRLYSDWLVLADLVCEGGVVTNFTTERICELRSLGKLVKEQEQEEEIIERND